MTVENIKLSELKVGDKVTYCSTKHGSYWSEDWVAASGKTLGDVCTVSSIDLYGAPTICVEGCGHGYYLSIYHFNIEVDIDLPEPQYD